MRKLIIAMVFAFIFIAMPLVSAHCPLCSAAAGAGVGIARFYGVDDSIVGLFLGAFVVSTALWFNKLLKKKINFPLQQFLLVMISFLLLAVPFYYSGLIINADMVRALPNSYSILGLGVFGIDKLLGGMIIGSSAIWFVFSLGDYMKKKRGLLFPYQSISFMLLTLIILSGIFYLITK